MKEIFDEHYRFMGDLIAKDLTLKNIICELTINTYDPNNMEVNVIPTEGNLFFIFSSIKNNDTILIKSKAMKNEIILEVGLPSFEMNSKTGQIGSFVVFQCTLINYYKEEIRPNKIHCSSQIPHSSIFGRSRSFTTHHSRGILSGWSERKENNLTNDMWEEEEYSYKTDTGFLKISPSFIFGEFSFDVYKEKAKFLVDQTYLSLTVKHKELNESYIEKQFLKNTIDFLKILSFCEGEFLESKSIFFNYYFDDKILKEKKIYSRIKKMSDTDKNKNHYRKNRKNYQSIVEKLFNSFKKQDNQTQQEIVRIIDRFLIAATQKIIDTQLIYWHSCLDIINKYFNSMGKSFSHKLIDGCSKNGIEWLDLFPNVTEESLKTKNGFLINKFRNDMLHYGIYPQDYNLVFKELYRTRALCERFICKMLNIDYRNSGIGFPQY